MALRAAPLGRPPAWAQRLAGGSAQRRPGPARRAGVQRFRVLHVLEQAPVLMCEVELLPDDDDSSEEVRGSAARPRLGRRGARACARLPPRRRARALAAEPARPRRPWSGPRACAVGAAR